MRFFQQVPRLVLFLIAAGLMAEMSPAAGQITGPSSGGRARKNQATFRTKPAPARPSAASSAQRRGNQANFTTKLAPPVGGDEPQASGTAKIEGTVFWGWGTVEGTLTVTCRGLTPYETYVSRAGTFEADSHGTGKATVSYGTSYPPQEVISVGRVVGILPDGSPITILVLQGAF